MTSLIFKHIFLLVFFSLLYQILLAQKHSISYYTHESQVITDRFYQTLPHKDLWRPYENEVESIIDDMDEDLKSGSGLSFDDMNLVRHYNKILRTILDFGDGVANGGYNKMFNGRMLNDIQKLFPAIKVEKFNNNSCTIIYKITFFDYTVLVARHNERGVLKKIYWWDSKNGCVILGGNFNLNAGVYRQFWNNSECQSYNGSGINIKNCEFVMAFDDNRSSVKSFTDN